MKNTLLLAGAMTLCAGMAQADPIERACLRSEREGATRGLCNCIQLVADITLSRRDQRVAAGFFGDPHQAQVIRQSDNRRHETFWKRYTAFGGAAEQYCR